MPDTLLALDLATRRIGYALLAPDAEPLVGSVDIAGRDLAERLHGIGHWLSHWLAGVQGPVPTLLAIETPDLMAEGMETNPATLKALYGALGVCHEVARRAGVAVVEKDPRDVREATTRRRTGSKAEQQVYLQRRGYALPRRGRAVDHDAADALALGVVVMDEAALLARAEVRA